MIYRYFVAEIELDTCLYELFFVDFDPRIMSAAFGSLKLGHPVCYDLDSLLLAVILRKHVRI